MCVVSSETGQQQQQQQPQEPRSGEGSESVLQRLRQDRAKAELDPDRAGDGPESG
jgi:hypothetical protein